MPEAVVGQVGRTAARLNPLLLQEHRSVIAMLNACNKMVPRDPRQLVLELQSLQQLKKKKSKVATDGALATATNIVAAIAVMIVMQNASNASESVETVHRSTGESLAMRRQGIEVAHQGTDEAAIHRRRGAATDNLREAVVGMQTEGRRQRRSSIDEDRVIAVDVDLQTTTAVNRHEERLAHVFMGEDVLRISRGTRATRSTATPSAIRNRQSQVEGSTTMAEAEQRAVSLRRHPKGGRDPSVVRHVRTRRQSLMPEIETFRARNTRILALEMVD